MFRHLLQFGCSVHELSRRNFLDVQMRKQRKWKLEDETRRSSMKLPSISAAESLRPSSMMVLYHSPTYKGQSDLEDGHTSGMLPYMVLRKERTEILYHRNKSFITHFPTTILEDEKKLKKYKNFVNAKISAPTALADDRFKELKYALSPRITSSKLKKYQRKAPEEPEPCEDSDDSSYSSAPHFQRRITNFTDGRRSTKLVLPVLSRSKPGTGKSKHTVTEPSRLQREGASLQLVRNDTIEHTDRHTVENGWSENYTV